MQFEVDKNTQQKWLFRPVFIKNKWNKLKQELVKNRRSHRPQVRDRNCPGKSRRAPPLCGSSACRWQLATTSSLPYMQWCDNCPRAPKRSHGAFYRRTGKFYTTVILSTFVWYCFVILLSPIDQLSLVCYSYSISPSTAEYSYSSVHPHYYYYRLHNCYYIGTLSLSLSSMSSFITSISPRDTRVTVVYININHKYKVHSPNWKQQLKKHIILIESKTRREKVFCKVIT